jgi:hypothetical protein
MELLDTLAGYLLELFDSDDLIQIVLPTEADWKVLREVVLRARTPNAQHPVHPTR